MFLENRITRSTVVTITILQNRNIAAFLQAIECGVWHSFKWNRCHVHALVWLRSSHKVWIQSVGIEALGEDGITHGVKSLSVIFVPVMRSSQATCGWKSSLKVLTSVMFIWQMGYMGLLPVGPNSMFWITCCFELWQPKCYIVTSFVYTKILKYVKMYTCPMFLFLCGLRIAFIKFNKCMSLHVFIDFKLSLLVFKPAKQMAPGTTIKVHYCICAIKVNWCHEHPPNVCFMGHCKTCYIRL